MIRLGKIKKGIVFGLCFFVVACSFKRDSLSPKEYVGFLNSKASGLNQIKAIDHIRFSCRLQPPELITLLSSVTTYSNTEQFEIEKKHHSDQLNVIFLIEDDSQAEHRVKETIFKTETYSQLLSYANNQLQNDFGLQLPNGEIIPCSFVHLEAANSVAPIIRINLAFYNVKSDIKEYTLIFDDNIFNTGRIKFHYSAKMFDNLPTLKI